MSKSLLETAFLQMTETFGVESSTARLYVYNFVIGGLFRQEGIMSYNKLLTNDDMMTIADRVEALREYDFKNCLRALSLNSSRYGGPSLKITLGMTGAGLFVSRCFTNSYKVELSPLDPPLIWALSKLGYYASASELLIEWNRVLRVLTGLDGSFSELEFRERIEALCTLQLCKILDGKIALRNCVSRFP